MTTACEKRGSDTKEEGMESKLVIWEGEVLQYSIAYILPKKKGRNSFREPQQNANGARTRGKP